MTLLTSGEPAERNNQLVASARSLSSGWSTSLEGILLSRERVTGLRSCPSSVNWMACLGLRLACSDTSDQGPSPPGQRLAHVGRSKQGAG
jgi:hypothetical protein